MNRNSDDDPLIMTIQLGHICNMRHVFCPQSYYLFDMLPREFLYDKLVPSYKRARYIHLSGGEATMSPDVREFIAFLRSCNRDADIVVSTNGLIFDESWVELCSDNGVLVDFLLNGTNARTAEATAYDAKGSYRRVRENFDRLLLRHKSAKQPLINCVSMFANQAAMSDMLDFIAFGLERGVNVRFEYFWDFNQAVPAPNSSLERVQRLCAPHIDVHVANNPVSYFEPRFPSETPSSDFDALDWNAFVAEHPPAQTRNRYVDWMSAAGRPRRERCPMPGRGVSISAEGDMFPCPILRTYDLGNLQLATVDEMLSNDAMREFRRLMEQGDYRYCWKYCPLRINATSDQCNRVGGIRQYWSELFRRKEYETLVKKSAPLENIRWNIPYYAESLFQRAVALQETGETGDAMRFYDIAWKWGYPEAELRLARGALHLSLGETEAAGIDVQRVLELQPENERALLLKKRLRDAGRNPDKKTFLRRVGDQNLHRVLHAALREAPTCFAGKEVLSIEASEKFLVDAILGDAPFFIGRYGPNEFSLVYWYLRVFGGRDDVCEMPDGITVPGNIRENFRVAAGFFSDNDADLLHYCRMILRIMRDIDGLTTTLVQNKKLNLSSE